VAIAAAVAVAIRLVGGHAFPDYDATYALIWGRDIAHGHAPDYAVSVRPAGHPLLMLVTTLASPLGRQGAADVVSWLALLGAGAFVAALFRFGQALAGTAAGAVAALLLFTREPLWGFSLLAFMDLLAAAFVFWAGTLELRAPRRGAPVLVLLAVAGLLRPEVWLIAGVYWLWCGRPWRLLPLAALAPLLWITWDLATTQTFLGSVTPSSGVEETTSTAGHGVIHAPGALARYVGGFVRPPEAVAAAAGMALAFWRRDRRALIPAALLVLNVVTFVLVALTKGPLEQRYLVVAAGAALAFAGYAIVAPWAARAGERSALRVAAAVLALACIAYAPIDARRIRDLHRQVAVAWTVDRELRDVVRAPVARCALRGHVHVADVRLRPFLAYWTATPEQRIGTEPGGTGELVATDSVAAELTSRSLPDHVQRTPLRPPAVAPGLRVLSASSAWRLSGRCAQQ
jgi:hypothetical protein